MIRGNDQAMPQYNADAFTGDILGITGGLTKREFFAAMAMAGILANPYFLEQYTDTDIHTLSVMNADSVIEALNKNNGTN